MATPPLPISVEELLERIRIDKQTEAADYRARVELQRINEAEALNVLRKIYSSQKIGKLSSFITFMVKKYRLVDIQPVEVETDCFSHESVEFSRPSSLNSAPSEDDLSNASTSSRRTLYIPTREQHKTCGPFREQAVVISPPNQKPNSVMEALGMLEFKKAFLILSYVGSQKLDDIISLDSLFKLQWLPMTTFERELWNIVRGKTCLCESDRRKNFDWESTNYFIYHCHVDLSGNTCFKGPYLQDTSTHLHRTFGDDNVLNVKFAINSDDCVDALSTYHKTAEEGIKLGLRNYRFFVYKDGGMEKKKSPNISCYFVRTESNWAMDTNKPYILQNNSIEKARCIFMHVHTVSSVAKYMARFSLILSKTMKLEVNFASLDFRIIEDTPCLNELGQGVYDEDGELKIHTDGTGLVSEDLAKKCPRRVFHGRDMKPKYFEKFLYGLDRGSSVRDLLSVTDEPPLLLQIRLFYNGYAVKGTLLVDKRLPPNTICVRPSMIKVDPDPILPKQHCSNSLEVVGTSNLSQRTCLSKSIIALLHYGGVSKEFFLDLTTQEINNAMDARLSKKSALKVAVHYGNMDNHLLARMILCGIPLDEPFLQSRLLVLMRQELNGLKNGRIPITESYNLMGTTDPTGKLGTNEVCIILESGQISGYVLVYKHPGLHFGDIHVLKAVFVKDMETVVGNSKFAIIFPTKGPRSLADEIANSDFDGDMYWVSKNPQLIQSFKPSIPWKWSSKPKTPQQMKPTDFTNADLERVLFHRFLKGGFSPSHAMSEASDSWMAYMDRLLTPTLRESEKTRLEEKIRKLVDLYYIALDAPKTDYKVEVPRYLKASEYPHHLERSKTTYKSSSILGLIFDKVVAFQVDDYTLHEINTLPCMSEPAPLYCLNLWSKRFDDYRKDMSHAMQENDESKSSAADQVYEKYKRMLYEAEEFEKSRRNEEEILNEALAIYQIVYNHVNSSVNKKGTSCTFAWKVAGHALCKLHAKMQADDTTFICLKSVLREAL